MKTLPFLLMALVLSACGPPASIETVESLMTNPERLKALRKQCKLDRAKLGDALCNAVAEAARRRFIGDGTAPYTPQPAKPD